MTTTQNPTRTTRRGRHLSATTLIGDNVVNAQGDSLGEITDFMMDLDTGAISYAILSFGGFLGMGNKLFAVPFEALRVDTTNERFVLDVSKEKLENAPGFDEDHWPSHADDTFLNEVYNYYGYGDYRNYNERFYGSYDKGRYQNRYTYNKRDWDPTDDSYQERVRRSREEGMMEVVDENRNGV